MFLKREGNSGVVTEFDYRDRENCNNIEMKLQNGRKRNKEQRSNTDTLKYT
jgi:hypothetical protein